MPPLVAILKATLMAAIMAIFGAVAVAQEVGGPQTVAGAIEPAATHFDAQYEDSGVRVYITKMFPPYQLKEGQMVVAQTIFLSDLLRSAGIPRDSHRIFHAVSDDAAEMIFSPIIAGTRAGIVAAAARENTNKVVGAVGAVVMFGVARGMSGASTSALSNLSGLRDVVGTGILKSADFQNPKIDNPKIQSIQAGEGDVIYVSKLEVKHRQNDNSLGDGMLYFVMPKEIKGEVLNGKNLHEYRYGANFSNVLSRAILRAANLTPAIKVPSGEAAQ